MDILPHLLIQAAVQVGHDEALVHPIGEIVMMLSVQLTKELGQAYLVLCQVGFLLFFSLSNKRGEVDRQEFFWREFRPTLDASKNN